MIGGGCTVFRLVAKIAYAAWRAARNSIPTNRPMWCVREPAAASALFFFYGVNALDHGIAEFAGDSVAGLLHRKFPYLANRRPHVLAVQPLNQVECPATGGRYTQG